MTYNPSEALRRIDNDTALLTMLIGVFLKERPAYCERLKQASQAQHIGQLGDAAHNVKGASAAIGLESARAIAAQLESLCRREDNPEAANFQRLTEELIAELVSSETLLKQWAAMQG
jgi:HPt (histidine-containing phosphotransfer) domain-containing protein